MAADFEQVIFLICLFFTWVLCISTKVAIFCMSGVQPHVDVPTSSLGDEVVGVHLSSDQMTYDLMMDAD